jgi:ribosomal protein S18 acetylase RimI-like enzyme
MKIVSLDTPHLAPLLAAIDELGLCPGLDEAWLRRRALDDPTSPPELLLLAEEGESVVGFCLGAARGERLIVKLFGVRPAAQRRGVASALFTELEARGRARGLGQIAVEGAAPLYFTPGVDLAYTPAVSFLVHRGYETDRVARVDMAVDLPCGNYDTTEVARFAQSGLTLRRATVAEVARAAVFAGQQFNPAWQREVADTAVYDPPTLFVALRGEEIVSFAAYDVTGVSRFGPTGTLPELRRQGLGATVLKMCLRDMQQRGDALSEIAWAGPVGFYARAVNARIHRAYWLFHKALS